MKLRAVFLCCIFTVKSIFAAQISVPMNITTGTETGKSVGSVIIIETKYGLLFKPAIHDLTPGMHGFHIHQNPSCGENGMSSGGHLDPQDTGKHLGPYNDKGHLGDLPALYVSTAGTADLPLMAPRLSRLSQIKNHALMIHAGGDNYSDKPEKLGGGAARMACGVVK